MTFIASCFLFLSFLIQVSVASEVDGHGRLERDFDGYAGAKNLSALDILNKGIEALGGYSNLNALKGAISHAYLYRVNTLVESYVPSVADTEIASGGTQSISYDLSGDIGDIVQRVDRQYQIGEFFTFARPLLEDNDVSIVTRGGKDGYSCYVKGNELILLDPNLTSGYTDPVYANILLRDATRLYPKLLLAFRLAPNKVASTLLVRDVSYPAVTDTDLNITIAFRPDTFLPYIIRSYEYHEIFGESVNDFVIYNYTEVAGVHFPRRVKIVYNEDNLLLDTIIDTIEVNPSFPPDFFQGLPSSRVNETVFKIPPVPAKPSVEYGEAEVFEFSQNALWAGGYTGKLSNVNVTYPVPELPGLIYLVFVDAPTYKTTIANMEDVVMVTDAPAHQSKLVIQWVQENLKKNVTHLLLSHHHHDHAYGAADYVAVGATLVVPQDFTYYYSKIPGVRFAPVTVAQPFIHRSEKMQVRAVWPGVIDLHASDWMYFTFTPRCPAADSPLAVSIADAWSPGFSGYLQRHDQPISYLATARKAGLPKEYLVLPAHGVPTPITQLYAETGYDYPDYNILNFLPGGPWC